MKKRNKLRLLLPLLVLCLCFGACSTDGDGASGNVSSGTEESTVPDPTGDIPPEANAFVVTEPDGAWPIYTADSRLRLDGCASYTGLYPEDGTDEQVEGVAAILVTNVSSELLQLGTLTMTVDGQQAEFEVTQLLPGKSAWVLEANRLQAEKTAEYEYLSDTTAFGALQLREGITVQGGDGSLTLTNNGTEDCPHVAVYYKLLYDDGAYLGGITYRVSVTELPAGESQTVTAGHYYVNAAEIVGIYAG